LLEPVSLAKGAEVEVVILANEDDVRALNELDMLWEMAISIEHGLQGSLGIMDMILLSMKQKYQESEWPTEELEQLEEQKRRIFDTTRVLSLLQASPDITQRRMKRAALTELIHTAIRGIKERLNDENIKFQISGHEVFTKADSRMLGQAITPLIQNFVDAIGESGRQSGVIHINLESGPQPDEMSVIQITDRHRTLPEKGNQELRDLFSPYRRSRDTLSLFLVQRIIRFHDGFTRLQRVSEQGATLSIFLPAG
jgi:K+-sensing histidine kinase KdpD